MSMRSAILAAALAALLTPAPVQAFECPTAPSGAASIYEAGRADALRLAPSADAPPVGATAPGDTLAVLEVSPACRLPEGWLRADSPEASGYVHAADLRPRITGMPDQAPGR